MLRIPFVLLLNILGTVRWALANLLHAVALLFRGKRRRYVLLELHGHYPFGHPRGLIGRLRTEATFLELRRDIKTLGDDPRVAGVVLKPGHASLGAARAGEVTELLDTLRERGKHVVAQSDTLMTRDYLEATAADDILLAPAGRMYTFGPRFEQVFFADALQRHGVTAQFIHIGAFKTAANRFVRTAMGTAERLMLSSIRDGLQSRWLERIGARRNMSPEQARRLFALAPCDSRTAVRERFLDGEAFDQDLESWLATRGKHVQFAPEGPPASDYQMLTFDEWKHSRPTPWKWRPLLRRPSEVAVVDLSGMIVTPGMKVPGSQAVIDAGAVIPVLRQLRDSRRVAAVILHINSPGGSVVASDLIWKAIEDLRCVKPVIAYCTDVVGSGGYYLAVAADEIICRPETIAGSIGVIMGKVSLGEAASRLGVTHDAVGDEDGGEFLSPMAPLEGRLLDNAHADARATYRRFLQRVGRARGLSKRRLHRYARGRVYLADQALQRGLIDEVSDFDGAVRAVVRQCDAAGIPIARDPKLHFVAHGRHTLRDALTRSAISASGPISAAVEPLAVASMLRREQTLVLMPFRII